MSTALDQLNASLPTGFIVRSAQLEDAQDVTDLLNAEYDHFGTPTHLGVEVQEAEWTTPNHNLAENSIVIENAEGTIVGSADVWAFMNPLVRMRLLVTVHPTYYHTGIYALLLAWCEQQAISHLNVSPQDVQVSVYAGAMEENSTKRKTIEATGFVEVRRFYQMQIDMTEAPTVYALPDGYHYDIYRHPEQLREIVRIDTEAFRDHFGFVETDFDEHVEEIRHFLETMSYFNPNLFYNIVDDATGEIVAEIWNLTAMDGDSSIAYVDNVAVLREHRGKGIAIAMLTYSLNMHYQAGRKSVALHVDAGSLTGALSLYKKAGMRPMQTSVRYEKILRTGVDLVTRQLAE